MGLIFDWIDKIRRYTKLKPGELKAALISIMVIAFAISFSNWGIGKEVDISYGFINLFGAIIIVAITFFGRLYLQKIVALGADYQVEYKIWSFGLLFILLTSFLTSSFVDSKFNLYLFLIPGGIVIHYMAGHRLGWVRYGLNFFGLGVVSLAGPIANIILAMIFRTLFEIFHLPLFYTAFLLNLIWALWTMLPIPPSDGSRMIFGSRMVYMFGLAVVVSSAILLYSKINIIITILGSFVIAWIWWLIYYILWERFNWKGPY
ncbi:MAG: hypothetical protein KAK00_02870 [Nanoarchaeota archaeon]|nr:hypothetical protein [Nanoarchaeota archaeon]